MVAMATSSPSRGAVIAGWRAGTTEERGRRSGAHSRLCALSFLPGGWTPRGGEWHARRPLGSGSPTGRTGRDPMRAGWTWIVAGLLLMPLMALADVAPPEESGQPEEATGQEADAPSEL